MIPVCQPWRVCVDVVIPRRLFAISVKTWCDYELNSVVDVGMLEHALRDDLDQTSPRAMAVLRPLKIVIENVPEG